MKRCYVLLVILLMFSQVLAACAQVSPVPPLMNFQGRLTKPDGTPVRDGSYSVRFSLWDAVSGGTEKWNQTINPVTVRNGTFAVLLSGFPGGTFVGNLWLEIKIGANSPLTPRQPLVTVAYAFKADLALTVPDGSIGTTQLANNSVTSAKILNGTITGSDIANQGVASENIADNSISTRHLQNGGILTEDLSNSAVTSAKIADGTIATVDIANLAVTNAKINDVAWSKITGVPLSIFSNWSLFGNPATNPLTQFLGTTDNQPFNIRVNNTRAMRYEEVGGTINILGGSPQNALGINLLGATIAGGGSGGGPNIVNTNFGTIGGGESNIVTSLFGTVSGGQLNTALGQASTVGGGIGNTAGQNQLGFGTATVSGGQNNTASGLASTVPGGFNNIAKGDYSFAAGNSAQANQNGTFVWADGQGGPFASLQPNQFLIRAQNGVGINTPNTGGKALMVDGDTQINGGGGGEALIVNGVARVNGGIMVQGFRMPVNAAPNMVLTSVTNEGDGVWVALDPWVEQIIHTTWIDWNQIINVPPLPYWSLNGNLGNSPGDFLGTWDDQPLTIRVNSQRAMRYESVGGNINVLGGSESNTITGSGGTIAGGGTAATPNRILADFGTVGGGSGNRVNNYSATIAGGNENAASGDYAIVGGGYFNAASGSFATIAGGAINSTGDSYATVGGGNYNFATGYNATVAGGAANTAGSRYASVSGGSENTANGNYAIVAGGRQNTAAGQYSFAAGLRAKANHNGAFVWGDSTDADFASTAANQFLLRAAGGVAINTNDPAGFALNVAGNIQCVSLTQTSDGRYKTNIIAFPNALDAIQNLRGVTFDWKQADFPRMNFSEGRQIGFIAQEVEKVLPELVATDQNGYKSVAYANVVPVLVEAVKTLHSKVERLQKVEAENAELKARLDAIEAALAELKASIEK